MKYKIASTDSHLQLIFNSESFVDCNYDMDFPDLNKKLRLSGDYSVGDKLYFHGNYYEQYPVEIVRIIKNPAGFAVLYCRESSLYEIDPYMYDGIGRINKSFVNEVLENYKSSKDSLGRLYEEDLKKYGPECSKIAIYANNIIDLMAYEDRTVVDHTNVHWNVCEILSKNFPDEFNEWHRPSKYEFEEY